VVDPVMVATSGSSLMQDDASQALRTQLLPLADVITPNVPEGEVLSGVKIETKADMLVAADLIASAAGTSVLLKGGHLKDSADDLLFMDGKASWFESERIENPNTHGTGCTLSSAIAANLALGHGMEASIRQAKAYITGALRDGMDLGKGSGPLNHAYGIN
ncbi:MAG: bifunctional hydroxymethylpyrimidine kinase/phosphomethylpyrimidine kinase, partial [Trichococcus flocculiformis]